jgi:tetratricopeptide (TPR) repeat protein
VTDRRPRGFLAAAIVCAVLVVGAYWNSLGNAFHFDDSHVVENNLYIRSLHNVPRFFTDATTFSSIRSHASYRPLLSLTLAVDYAAGGLDPRPYHRTQIALLVALGAMLVFFYTRLLDQAGLDAPAWTALAAATLFSVHTANTETLNFISSRSEELSVIGVVGSFLVWLAWPRLRGTGLHLLPMALGALAKVHAVMYGALLFAGVWIWQPEGTRPVERTRKALGETWLALAVSAVVYFFIRRMDAPEWTGGGSDRLAYAWTQPYAWLHYARLFVLPTGLTADSDWSVFPSWHDPRALVGYAFAAVLVLVVALTWQRRATAPVAFGVAWFVIALAPTSSVVPFSEIVNEHRVFFPFVGLTLAAAGAISLALAAFVPALEARRAAGAGIAMALLAAHTAGTVVRNQVWKSEESLWLDVTEKSPLNGRGLMNYGLTLMARGDLQTARSYFERAARLTPNYSTLEINLGIVNGALGQPVVAEAHFLRALVLVDDADGHFYYARWLTQAGRAPAALPHLRRALAISPGFMDARRLAMRLDAAGDETDELRRVALDTLAIDGRNSDAVAYARGASPFAVPEPQAMNAGLIALNEARPEDAAEWFRGVLLTNPQSADAWNNRGWAQYKLGFMAAARASYLRALQINPADERARNNLALLDIPVR